MRPGRAGPATGVARKWDVELVRSTGAGVDLVGGPPPARESSQARTPRGGRHGPSTPSPPHTSTASASRPRPPSVDGAGPAAPGARRASSRTRRSGSTWPRAGASTPAESTRRVATTRRGGYCYQLNGAFGTLLTALGYQVSVHVAGVHEAERADRVDPAQPRRTGRRRAADRRQPRRPLVGRRRPRRRVARPDAPAGRCGRPGADAVRDGRGRRGRRRRLAPDPRPVRLLHRRQPGRRARRRWTSSPRGTSSTRRHPSRASPRRSPRSGGTRPA